MCLYMGVICAVLLIKAVIDLKLQWFIVLIYCVSMVIWTAGSFAVRPPRDHSISGFGIVVDVLVGAFAGVTLAASAIAIWQSAKFDADYGSGSPEHLLSLGQYLSCEGLPVWRKFTAIFPRFRVDEISCTTPLHSRLASTALRCHRGSGSLHIRGYLEQGYDEI